MENKTFHITWCYPDLLNLHGDRGNIMALERVGRLLGLEVIVHKIINLEDAIDFENSDMLFFNPGELKIVKPMVEALREKKEALTNYIESGKLIVAIGTSGAIFSKEVKRLNETFEGLGYLDMTCTEREMVYGDDIIFNLIEEETVEINGSQIQMIDTTLHTPDIALGKLSYGRGNDGLEEKLEGAKYHNVIFTNCLGPLFVKNPWYAEKLIREAMAAKGISLEKEIDPKEYELEFNSMECIKQYQEKKLSK